MAGVSRVSGLLGPVVYGGLTLAGGGGGDGSRLGLVGLGCMGLIGCVLAPALCLNVYVYA